MDSLGKVGGAVPAPPKTPVDHWGQPNSLPQPRWWPVEYVLPSSRATQRRSQFEPTNTTGMKSGSHPKPRCVESTPKLVIDTGKIAFIAATMMRLGRPIPGLTMFVRRAA